MRSVLLWLCVGAVWCGLQPPGASYNVLMLLPFSSKSHRNVFIPLANALVERGHKVTMLSNDAPPTGNTTVTYLQHALPYWAHDKENVFKTISDRTKLLQRFQEMFPKIGREFYDDPTVNQLWEKRDTFDVFIIDKLFNEVTLYFAIDKPLLFLSPGIIDNTNSAVMGNPLNPAYVASYLDALTLPLPATVRWRNIFASLMMPYTWNKNCRDLVQAELSKKFPDKPLLKDLETRQDLYLFNSHFTITGPLPLLPNQVEVGGMHLRPAKPLPADLEAFLSGNTPVVYFSLGSIAKSKDMDPKHIQIFLKAFAMLPYKVLWKYEETFDNLPSNILVQKWMPQQDILAHKNVKVFITHCGFLGTQEALYHGTPLMGLPIFGDQPKNAKLLQQKGFGRYLTWDQLTTEALVDNIKKIIENPEYSQTIADVSSRLKDQLTTPTERGVYWVEYVIRHKGAKHLRSPAADLSWRELLHLDLIVIIYIAIYCLCKITSKMLSLCFGGKNAKTKKE